MWKIKINIPNSLGLKFKLHKRSQAERVIFPPLPQINRKLQTKYEESFIIKGAKLWNVIPPPLTTITELKKFRAELKKHLEKLPDRPPITGYLTFGNDNSLTQL